MKAPLRRGACPTLATPMQTGDGLLARLNPVASGVSPEQLIGLCRAAGRHGNGIIEITGRGSLQIRGLTAMSTSLLAAEVDALGIEVQGGVRVETGPLAGLDPDEIADPRPLARRIRDGITDFGLERRLGPKVSVVVDGGGRSGLDALAADVRLTAVRNRVGVTWRLAVAGDAFSATPLGDLAELTANDAALAVLEAIAALGREGRARDLSRQALPTIVLGNQHSMLPPSGLPVISRSTGEIARSSIPAILDVADLRNSGGQPISPLERVIAGRAEGGVPSRDAYTNQLLPPGIILPLVDGRFAITTALPFGHMQADHLTEFTQRSQALGATELRLAPRRALILLCPSEDAAEAVCDAARQAGLIIDAADPRARIHACAGAPACASGHIPARKLATEIARAIPAGSQLDLHVSGCEKRCARPGHAGWTLLGLPDSAGLVREGAPPMPLATVAKEQAVDAIGRVAALVSAERTAGESEPACFARIGKSKFIQAFQRDR